MVIEIVDFPINSMVIFNSYDSLPGRVDFTIVAGLPYSNFWGFEYVRITSWPPSGPQIVIVESQVSSHVRDFVGTFTHRNCGCLRIWKKSIKFPQFVMFHVMFLAGYRYLRNLFRISHVLRLTIDLMIAGSIPDIQ